ncbi:MAG: hypothetical protein V1794_03750 [Candidatus Glassbacteria bacterium]
MRKSAATCFILAWISVFGIVRVCNAQEKIEMKGRLGVGIQSNLLNFGLGPTVEFFTVENFSLAGSFGALSDFTSYGIRGNLFFNKTKEYRPFLGAGYSQINGPEATPVFGSKLETKGSGLEIFGGLLQLASKNLGIRYEIIYGAMHLTAVTTTYSIPSHGGISENDA